MVTETAYTNDAGIAAVIAAAPTTNDETITLDTPLAVTGAIITNTGYARDESVPWDVWIGDGAGVIRTWGANMETAITAATPGMSVSFNVTEIKNYAGEIEITGLTDWVVNSENNDVFVWELNETVLDYSLHGRQNAHLWGEILTDAEPCGGSFNCYTYAYGAASATLRMKDVATVLKGDCVELVAPVGTFAGNIQFNVADLDWYQWY
jgi:hypothetical protein